MSKKICGECINFDRSLSKCNKLQDDSIKATDTVLCCRFYELKPPTLFDRITASPDVLARSLCGTVRVACFSGYYSMLTGMYYPDMEKAIAATLEKLNKVSK